MSVDFFEAAALPDVQKETLCRGLLAEFGVRHVSSREPDGELIHCCVMPWHPEKKPSASLNYKKLTYKCLGCLSSGGLLWLIATVRGISGPEARAWLNEQTGLGGADFDLQSLLQVLDALYENKSHAAAPIPRFADRVLEPWRAIHPVLTDGVPELGISGRGIPVGNLVAMEVGYAPEYEMGVNQPTSERIVIPHRWRGDLVGWQTRRVFDDGTPKYKSTADFPKHCTIYNYDSKRRKALVVESPMSVLRHLHHLPIEGTFGADITEAQVRLLARHEQVVIWLDPDPAGWKAVEGWTNESGEHTPGLIERLAPYSDVRVVDSDWAADPADLDDQTAHDLYENAVPWPVWSRPTGLRCLSCKQIHGGDCVG